MTASLLDSLSNGQHAALAAITKWFHDGGRFPFTLGGLAGTGKTTLAGLLPEVLPDTRIAYVAYTGKAVSVLRHKLPASIPAEDLTTIHRRLYQPQVARICLLSDLLIPGDRSRSDRPAKNALRCALHLRQPEPCPVRQQISFTPVDSPLAGYQLVVADEASMIPERLWQDLTCHGVPVLAIGDHGQLPPVRSSFNLMAAPDFRLEEIHRQAAGSPILAVARWAREQGHIPHGWYGENVVKIKPHDLGYVGLHPRDSDMIICATNATRMWHNAAMRAEHGRSGSPSDRSQPDRPVVGDIVICLRNNYTQGLFNGQRGVILETGDSNLIKDEPATGMTIQLDGLDEPWTGDVADAQFDSPETLSTLDRKLALFGYGYALTCHKSQGSQAGSVIVIEESWPTVDRERWLYTAVTRAEHTLTVVGW